MKDSVIIANSVVDLSYSKAKVMRINHKMQNAKGKPASSNDSWAVECFVKVSDDARPIKVVLWHNEKSHPAFSVGDVIEVSSHIDSKGALRYELPVRLDF
tara:strand:- start:7593 stop:7892 length:300 start_codon:yes stop_codon:yes gene_type:complete